MANLTVFDVFSAINTHDNVQADECVTTIANATDPTMHNGAIDTLLVESEPQNADTLASLINEHTTREAGISNVEDLSYSALSVTQTNNVKMVSPNKTLNASPPCPSMSGRRAAATFVHDGMTTRASSVNESIEKAPDTGGRTRSLMVVDQMDLIETVRNFEMISERRVVRKTARN